MLIIPISDLDKQYVSISNITARKSKIIGDHSPIKDYLYSIGYDNLSNRTYKNRIDYCVNGTAAITYKNNTITISPDTLYLIPATVDKVIYSESEDYTYYSIDFDIKTASANELVSLSDSPEIIMSTVPKNVLGDIYQITSAYKFSSYPFNLKGPSLVFQLLYDLINHIKLSPEDTSVKSETSSHSIYHVIHYLDTYFYTNPSDRYLAELCDLSEPYFRKCFKQATQMTPMEYKNLKRIQRSCEALKNSSQPIENIAKLVGFSTTNYFCRIFKKIMKTSPTQYRKLK